MITLDLIINTEYEDANTNEIVKCLVENELYVPLIDAIKIINQRIAFAQKEETTFQIANIAPTASCLLIKINERLRQIKHLDSVAEQLQYILGNITRRLLKLILDAFPKEYKHAQLVNIFDALYDTCQLFKYDFYKLSDFIQIDSLLIEIAEETRMEEEEQREVFDIPLQKVPCFSCKSLKLDHLPKFITKVESLDVFIEVGQFGKLFESPEFCLQIKLRSNKQDYILQFFAWLNSTKFITYDNCEGFYQVLEYHCVEFKNTFLRGKKPKSRIDEVKKLKNWNQHKNLFEKCFRDFT